jgi:hypothetical protein
MGHARTRRRVLVLVLLADGGAELDCEGLTVWASDADPEFAEEFGTEILDENDIGELAEYLVDSGYMTDQEADRALVDIEVYEPQGTESAESEHEPAAPAEPLGEF